MKFTTANEAIELLTRAVQERGEDYTYQPVRSGPDDEFGTCVYVDPQGSPSCLVGLALVRAGVATEELGKVESMPASLAISQLQISGRNSAFSMVMDSAQGEQDMGRTWGQALEAAQKMANEYPEILRKIGLFHKADEEARLLEDIEV